MAHAADTGSSAARGHGNDGPLISGRAGTGTANRPLSRRKIERRVAVACTACRRQHLRCDAATPSCTRCRSLDKRCVYTDIRRRRRNSRKADGPEMAGGSCEDERESGRSRAPDQHTVTGREVEERPREPWPELAPASDNVGAHGIGSPADGNPPTSPAGPAHWTPQELECSPGRTSGFGPSAPLTSGDPFASIPLDGFYTYFFPAHPFVLPREQLTRHSHGDPDSVSLLIGVMTLIGAVYTRGEKSHSPRPDAERMLEMTFPLAGFAVQALMLLALCLEWSGEGQRAADSLQRAKDMALELGMNRRSFATDYSQGGPVLEESWRRTWWELYVIDALFAGIRHWPTFSLWKVRADAHLPVDEGYYVSGVTATSFRANPGAESY